MAGYSGTPLAKKLGIKEGAAIALVRTPDDVQAELAAITQACRKPRPASRSLDFVMLFVTSQAIIIIMGMLPPRYWASFRNRNSSPSPVSPKAAPGGKRKPAPAAS